MLGVVACEAGKHFADKVFNKIKELAEEENYGSDIYYINSKEVVFPNTAIKTVLNHSVRENDIYVFQDLENSVLKSSVNDKFKALKTTIKAASDASAKYITAVVPVFPDERQDRIQEREGLIAEMSAEEIENSGASRVITLDVHNESIAGFFKKGCKFENLHSSRNIINCINENKIVDLENTVVVACDKGSFDLAVHYSNTLGTGLAAIYKKRDKEGKIEKIYFIGNVKGKTALTVDDLLDTCGTLENDIKILVENGVEGIYSAFSKLWLNGKALERINKAYNGGKGVLKGVIATDVIDHGGKLFKKENPWIIEVSEADHFASFIYNIHRGRKVSKYLK